MANLAQDILLLKAATATGTATAWPGGPGIMLVTGTFAGASVALQVLGPDGATYIAGGPVATVAGAYPFNLPPCTIKGVITGSPTGIYARVASTDGGGGGNQTGVPGSGTGVGYGVDVAVTPTVTNGAYSAGDIMGALMTFPVSRVADEGILLQRVQVALKAAVTPSLLLVLFSADPTGTTKTDNAAYSLAAADAFKVIATIPFATLGAYLVDHGTPNTYAVPNLGIPLKPESGGVNIYGLLVDLTGVTLTSTSDVQVRLQGMGL